MYLMRERLYSKGSKMENIKIEELITDEHIKRFWQKVSIPVDKSQCWLWLAAPHNSDSYGLFNLAGKTVKAHRVSWYLANGVDPGECLDHIECSIRKCVNPDHLKNEIWAVNSARTKYAISEYCKSGKHKKTEDNTYVNPNTGRKRCRDCASEIDKARYSNKYEKEKLKKTNNSVMRDFNAEPKLTAEEVICIRAKYETNEFSLKELAREYKVSPPAIRAIVSFKSWKDLSKYQIDYRQIEPTHCNKNHKYNDINKSYTNQGTLLCRECVKLTNVKRLQYKLEWQRQKKLKNQQDKE